MKTDDGNTIAGVAGSAAVSLSTVPQSNFDTMNRENEKRIFIWRNRVIAAVSPNVTYTGTWSYKNNSGEMNIMFTKIGQQQVNVEGQLYDPSYPNERIPFTGTLLLDEYAGHQIKMDVKTKSVRNDTVKSMTQRYYLYDTGYPPP